jgi:hypothetical protein
MKLQEWIQSIGNWYKLENGQGIALGGGVYGKYYENPPRKRALPPPAPQPLTPKRNDIF